MDDDEQRKRVLKLLQTAQALAHDLQEDNLGYLIERAIDECKASFVAPRGQAPYRSK